MNRRTKSTAISQKVKKIVFERDKGLCIICGRQGFPDSHIVRRSQGGMGVEQNIVTMCRQCHYDYDGIGRKWMKPIVEEYIKAFYPDWSEESVIYKR